MDINGKIFLEIQKERARQERLKKEGAFVATLADNEMTDWQRLAAVMEEVGEVATCVLEETNQCAIKEKKHDKEAEIIQVAACCWAWLENIYNN